MQDAVLVRTGTCSYQRSNTICDILPSLSSQRTVLRLLNNVNIHKQIEVWIFAGQYHQLNQLLCPLPLVLHHLQEPACRLVIVWCWYTVKPTGFQTYKAYSSFTFRQLVPVLKISSLWSMKMAVHLVKTVKLVHQDKDFGLNVEHVYQPILW